MPIVRFSQNSHNIMGRVAAHGKDPQADRIDVEDYWAKWLELKQKANVKTNEQNADVLSRSSLKSDSAGPQRSLALRKSPSAATTKQQQTTQNSGTHLSNQQGSHTRTDGHRSDDEDDHKANDGAEEVKGFKYDGASTLKRPPAKDRI